MNTVNFVSALVLWTTLFVFGEKPSDEIEERWITRPPSFRLFPYSVYVLMSQATDGFCTGTLLDSHWVLTAARCMYKGREMVVETGTSLTVYAGVDDRTKLTAKGVQKRSSIKLVFHKDTYHSLALIELSSAFEQDNGIQPATVSTDGVINVEDKMCNSGSYGQRSNLTNIKYMYLNLQNCKCHAELKKYYPKELEDKWVCGHFKFSGKVCVGDFGMGLMCDGELQAICVGVVVIQNEATCTLTEGTGQCDLEYTLGLFVDVCYYLDWLKLYVDTVQNASFNCDKRSEATSVTPTILCLICCVLLGLIHIIK